jgi:hypothetical protein
MAYIVVLKIHHGVDERECSFRGVWSTADLCAGAPGDVECCNDRVRVQMGQHFTRRSTHLVNLFLHSLRAVNDIVKDNAVGNGMVRVIYWSYEVVCSILSADFVPLSCTTENAYHSVHSHHVIHMPKNRSSYTHVSDADSCWRNLPGN